MQKIRVGEDVSAGDFIVGDQENLEEMETAVMETFNILRSVESRRMKTLLIETSNIKRPRRNGRIKIAAL